MRKQTHRHDLKCNNSWEINTQTQIILLQQKSLNKILQKDTPTYSKKQKHKQTETHSQRITQTVKKHTRQTKNKDKQTQTKNTQTPTHTQSHQ